MLFPQPTLPLAFETFLMTRLVQLQSQKSSNLTEKLKKQHLNTDFLYNVILHNDVKVSICNLKCCQKELTYVDVCN